ncbi:MAG: efflux RND transporter periplasmic adaptor subunit [Gammaproteobacteria bacterium]|nr:efflux RND transporter periplasmic adaptor subunit [Gammaproteobacteria bacterium]
MGKKKKALLFAVVLLICAWPLMRSLGEANEELRFTTAVVQRGPIAARVTATGMLSAKVTVQVGSQVSGRIAELHADFNSVVKKGQVLVRLDPQLFEASVEQAEANLQAATGGLARARAEAEAAERQAHRAANLFERHLIAQADLDSAQANAAAQKAAVVVAEGALAQARAALRHAQVNLAYTVITSPINGVVISRAVDVGQTVAASLQAPTLFSIAEDLKKMQVHTSVAESDIGKLNKTMPVVFGVDAYPGESFVGELAQIRNDPQINQNVVTYDAVLNVDNSDLRLKPGMTANVNFIYHQRQNVLLVPNAAFRFRPPEAIEKTAATAPGKGPQFRRALWVLKGGRPEAIVVETGITDGARTEIASDALQEGDELILDVAGEPAKASRPLRMF